jgi:anhydro-N-acetylmuramic acid kinase
MIVAGVMSGTSADGINVALVRIERGSRSASEALLAGGQECPPYTLRVLGHAEYPYPRRVRAAVLAAMNASRASVANLARLNFLLGEIYADAVLAAQNKFRIRAELVGCHGQTLYHQGEPAKFLGRKLAVTWQTGEGAVLAARVGVPVVSDFRPADMAAGGKGAPLVPFLDFLLYRDAKIGRIVQNIGGIANLTAIPAGAFAEQVIAFDTGPGNMVMDALTAKYFGKAYDRSGKIAASGKVLEKAVARVLREPYFRRKPPKTAGREQFGREFVEKFVKLCGRVNKRDIVATATAVTSRSIADAVRRLLTSEANYREFVVSGGGANNSTLIEMLRAELRPLGLQLRSSDEFGVPAEAKEAAAFALLAYQTWKRLPSNVPSATGAKRAAVLGKISYP